MKQLVEDFTTQLKEAIMIARQIKPVAEAKEISQVLISGLGGSGISASIIQNFCNLDLKVPLVVNKDYDIPGFVGPETLVVISSYSGNTEETVSAMKQAIKKKARIVCITSGGEIAEMAIKRNLECVLLPAGLPPRACIGYGLVQLMYVLDRNGLLSHPWEREIKAVIKLLDEKRRSIRQKAFNLSRKLLDTIPVIYAPSQYEGVAVRFRQQINENGKMLCWHHVIPEMNHNELVGWRRKQEELSVVFIRTEDESDRIQLRTSFTRKVVGKYTGRMYELVAVGKTYWERVFYLIHITDWISIYLAEGNGVDAREVRIINDLKFELGKV